MSKMGQHVQEMQEGQPETMEPDPEYDNLCDELYQELRSILKGKSDKAITDEHEKAARAVHRRMVG